MRLIRAILFLFFIVFTFTGIHTQTPASEKGVLPYADLTWMSNTNWLIETADVRILLDGWITRIPRPAERPDLRKPETMVHSPVVSDTVGIRRIFEALDGGKKINYIISGHSHFDHSFDTATWAMLTGARIMGPKSTCLQAMAQGIPESQCTALKDGDTFALGDGLHVRVVRWHHSGDPSDPVRLLLQTPMELVDVPTPDPVTGGLRPGILNDFPVGRCLGFLFTLNHPQHPLTWFWTNSGNPHTFTEFKSADEAFLNEYGITLKNLEIIPRERSAKECLVSAMHAEKVDHVDLWIGYGNSFHVEQVITILKPRVFIPQHWGGLWSSFFGGINAPYTNERLSEILKEAEIDLCIQNQFMDKFRLDQNGITPISNDEIKEKLGFLN